MIIKDKYFHCDDEIQNTKLTLSPGSFRTVSAPAMTTDLFFLVAAATSEQLQNFENIKYIGKYRCLWKITFNNNSPEFSSKAKREFFEFTGITK